MKGHPIVITCLFAEFVILRILGRDVLLHYQCTAFSPDPDWIRELIAEDRARRQ